VVSAISLAKARARASRARCASERCEEYSGRLRGDDALDARVETDDWDFVFVAALVELMPMLRRPTSVTRLSRTAGFVFTCTNRILRAGGRMKKIVADNS
jgi:hypothetical protein